MADEPMHMSAASGSGGSVTPRRRKSDQDSNTADSLTEFRANLIREISKRDREVGTLLSEKLDTHHAVIIGRLDGIQTTQDAHTTWIRARDTLQEEEDRQRAEQQLRASILEDLADAGRARRQAMRDKWGKAVTALVGALVTVLGGVLLYTLVNIDQWRWDRHGQLVTLAVLALCVSIIVLVRYGP